MEFLIRPAASDDAAALASVNVESWRAAYRGMVPQSYLDRLTIEDKLSRFETGLHESGHALVAEGRLGNVVGYSQFGLRRDGPEDYTAELKALYLLPGVQGQGLGGQLLKASVRILHTEGHRNVCTWAIKANGRARGFYEKWGGVLVAEQTFEIDDVTIPEVCYGWLDMADLLGE